MAGKGLVEWDLEPSAVPARGGHPMRRLPVTEEGREAARESRDVPLRFLEGLGAVRTGGMRVAPPGLPTRLLGEPTTTAW